MPCPESTRQIGSVGQPEILERCRSQARRVALRADDDHPDLMVAGLGDAPCRGGIEPPLEHVALHDSRTRDGPFTTTLLARTDVEQEGSRLELPRRLTRVDSVQPGPGRGQHLVDGHLGGHSHGATARAEPAATSRGASFPSYRRISSPAGE